MDSAEAASVPIMLREVDAGNWRACAALEVKDEQREFVMPVSYYLALCHYGDGWHPLAVCKGDAVVGFVMWAIDPSDNSGWLGGLTIDHRNQRRGFGRGAVSALLHHLREERGCTSAALSYLAAIVAPGRCTRHWGSRRPVSWRRTSWWLGGRCEACPPCARC